jgi:hypothetical protein
MGKLSIVIEPSLFDMVGLIVNPIPSTYLNIYTDGRYTELMKVHGDIITEAVDYYQSAMSGAGSEIRNMINPESVDELMADLEEFAHDEDDDDELEDFPLLIPLHEEVYDLLFIISPDITEDEASWLDYEDLMKMYMDALFAAATNGYTVVTLPLDFVTSSKYNVAIVVSIVHTCAMIHFKNFVEIIIQTTNMDILYHIGMKPNLSN